MINVDINSDIPIYRQIVDAITSDVKSGKLKDGDRLPTVRELSMSLALAKGTIKRAYDELEGLGFIRMTQGRGTFVAYRTQDSLSRKERAMEAMDGMLDLMEELSFSPTEVSIFFELKLRERVQRGYDVPISIVECCPETISMLSKQLYEIDGVDIYKNDLFDVLAYPYKIGENVDLVLTTVTHFDKLQSLISEPGKLIKLALRPTEATIASLAALDKGRIGIIAKSEKFATTMRKDILQFAPRTAISGIEYFDALPEVSDFLQRLDMVVVPEGYQQFCSSAVSTDLSNFAAKKKLIEFTYRADEGSRIYAEERIRAIQNRRRKGK